MSNPADPAAAPRDRIDGVGVRLIMLGWCLWLLASWGVTLWIEHPTAAVRWMVFTAFIGLTVIWPIFRLSQDTSARTTAAATIFLDWVCLMLIFQAVVWCLSLPGQWQWRQVLWIDAVIVSWSLLIGAVVALGRRYASSAARTAAMIACLLLVLGASAVRAATGWGAGIAASGGSAGGWALAAERWTQGLQPIAVLWELTQRPVDVDYAAAGPPVITAAVAATAAWIGVALLDRLQRRADRTA